MQINTKKIEDISQSVYVFKLILRDEKNNKKHKKKCSTILRGISKAKGDVGQTENGNRSLTDREQSVSVERQSGSGSGRR